MIQIFKGDSTTFADVTKFLTFHIETILDLTDWKAVFILGGITKEITDIESKSFEVILSNEDTSKLLYGKQFATVKLIDDKNQVKTVNNSIEFNVDNKIIDNKHEFVKLAIPQTTPIDLTLEIGQSGGGTDNYNELLNKPKINNVQLLGNKSLNDLGVQPKGNYATSAELQTLSEKQISTDDEVNFITGEVSDIKQELPTKLEVTNLIQGNNVTLEKQGNNVTINAVGGTTGTTDYNELQNIPEINNVALKGNKTLDDLNIQKKGDYATTSQLANKLEATNIIQGTNITLDKVGNNITINSTGGSTDNLVTLDTDQDITGHKTFKSDQAINSPELDIRTDRSKRGNGLIFTDKNGTQTAGVGVYINNNQSPECRFVASNGTKSAFAGLGVTTDGQGFFEIPQPSETSNNNDAVTSNWVNTKLATKANTDLSNTTEKLSDSFLDKFDMDITAGINIPIVKGGDINIPCDGYLQIFQLGYIRINYTQPINPEPNNVFFMGNTSAMELPVSSYIRVYTNIPIKFDAWQAVDPNAFIKFFPLKGAIHA